MRKVIKKCLATAMLMVMVFTMNVFAYDTGTGRVKVPKGSTFVDARTGIKRSLNYNYVKVKADSVYPIEEGKEDTYTRCKTRLYYKTTAISKEVTLEETKTGTVYIYNGQLSRKTFRIKLAGNSPSLAAWVDYYYNGK